MPSDLELDLICPNCGTVSDFAVTDEDMLNCRTCGTKTTWEELTGIGINEDKERDDFPF